MIYGEDEDYCNDLKAEIIKWKLLFIVATSKYALALNRQEFADKVADVMDDMQSQWFEVFGEDTQLHEAIENAIDGLAEEYRHE